MTQIEHSPPFSMLSRLVVAFVVLLSSCGGTATQVNSSDQGCNQTGRTVLGIWARPEIHQVANDHTLSETTGTATLWLPHDGDRRGCLFSNASHYLSMILEADQPATFIMVEYPRALRMDDAVLTIPGRGEMHQTNVRTSRFPPHEFQEASQNHVYMFAFPPSGPGTWDHIEMRVPIEGTDSSLRVRFVRDDDARHWLDPRCLGPDRRIIPEPSDDEIREWQQDPACPDTP